MAYDPFVPDDSIDQEEGQEKLVARTLYTLMEKYPDMERNDPSHTSIGYGIDFRREESWDIDLDLEEGLSWPKPGQAIGIKFQNGVLSRHPGQNTLLPPWGRAPGSKYLGQQMSKWNKMALAPDSERNTQGRVELKNAWGVKSGLLKSGLLKSGGLRRRRLKSRRSKSRRRTKRHAKRTKRKRRR